MPGSGERRRRSGQSKAAPSSVIAPDGASVVRLIGGFLAFLLCVWLLAATSGLLAMAPDTPLLVTRSDITRAEVLARIDAARVAQAATRGEVPAALRRSAEANAAELLRVDPLSSGALVLTSQDFRTEQTRAAARPRIAAAMARDPRSRQGIAWMIIDDVLSGRFARAARGFERMVSVSPDNSEAMVPMMALIANDDAARQILLRSLATPQSWHSRLASQLAGSDLPLPIIREFADVLGRNSDPAVRQSMLGALIERGDFSSAYRLWQQANGRQGRPAGAGHLADTAFTGSGRDYPFGWTFGETGSDRVTQRDGGGIEVRYSGQASTTFASMTTVLTPGRYQLVVRGTDATLRTEGLRWTMQCRPVAGGAAAPLLSLPLANVPQGQTAVASTFAVPAGGCAAQTLSLVGETMIVPVDRTVTIASVDVTPVR